MDTEDDEVVVDDELEDDDDEEDDDEDEEEVELDDDDELDEDDVLVESLLERLRARAFGKVWSATFIAFCSEVGSRGEAFSSSVLGTFGFAASSEKDTADSPGNGISLACSSVVFGE